MLHTQQNQISSGTSSCLQSVFSRAGDKWRVWYWEGSSQRVTAWAGKSWGICGWGCLWQEDKGQRQVCWFALANYKLVVLGRPDVSKKGRVLFAEGCSLAAVSLPATLLSTNLPSFDWPIDFSVAQKGQENIHNDQQRRHTELSYFVYSWLIAHVS